MATEPRWAARREQLVTRLARIEQRHASVDAHLHNRDRDLPQDFADRANVTANDEVLEALDDLSRGEIDQIRAAIERIDNDAYGVCVSCGDDIAPGRLDALPYAAMCTGCAQESGA